MTQSAKCKYCGYYMTIGGRKIIPRKVCQKCREEKIAERGQKEIAVISGVSSNGLGVVTIPKAPWE